MSVLDRKVLRDIGAMRGQVLTIALLIGAGVAVMVMSVSAWLSLLAAQQAHYRESRFAEVFAEVSRAPRPLLARIASVCSPGNGRTRCGATRRSCMPPSRRPGASARATRLPSS